MPISVACPECEKRLKVADTVAGKKIRCPACKAVVAVPDADDFVEPDEDVGITETPPAKKRLPARKLRDDDEEERRPKARKSRDDDAEDDEDRRPKSRRRRDDDEDEEEHGPRKKKVRRSGTPHRGTNILLFGIGSMLIACVPIAAWYLGWQAIQMANEDLDQMASGRMDDSGKGSTQIGKVCGIVGSVFGLLWLILAVTLKVMDR